MPRPKKKRFHAPRLCLVCHKPGLEPRQQMHPECKFKPHFGPRSRAMQAKRQHIKYQKKVK